jgi:hypothetical protein
LGWRTDLNGTQILKNFSGHKAKKPRKGEEGVLGGREASKKPNTQIKKKHFKFLPLCYQIILYKLYMKQEQKNVINMKKRQNVTIENLKNRIN